MKMDGKSEKTHVSWNKYEWEWRRVKKIVVFLVTLVSSLCCVQGANESGYAGWSCILLRMSFEVQLLMNAD